MAEQSMVKNITENDRLTTNSLSNASLLNGTSPTDERVLTRDRRYVMEDPIVLAILGVIAVIVIVIISKAVINKTVSRRRHIYRSESAVSYYISDPPPPYPGKHQKTSMNYLPSYDSAMAMERRRREAREQFTHTEHVSVDFSLSSETSETRGAANNTDTRNSLNEIAGLNRTEEFASGSRFNQFCDQIDNARINTISGVIPPGQKSLDCEKLDQTRSSRPIRTSSSLGSVT